VKVEQRQRLAGDASEHASCSGARVSLRRLLCLTACIAASGCGGGSPSSPSALESILEFVFRGETVSAIDGSPFGRVIVKIGSQVTQSDENGRFDVPNLREGSGTIVISGGSIVERQRTVRIPASDTSREALIPASFDLAAFDEMLRGAGSLQRWTAAPARVILGKEMQFDNMVSDDVYHAAAESLSEVEIDLLAAHLTEGLALLTANTFTSFASIEIEYPATGARVNTLRPGHIVAGRYRGVQTLASTIGFGRWTISDASEVISGAIFLDRNFDRSSDRRRLLRIHELGHALGYRHVKTRTSIMNPAIGPEPTEFDRQAAAISFQRPPGNQSPDNDIVDGPRAGSGGIFGGRTLVCGGT
jgi:hypothetical protein